MQGDSEFSPSPPAPACIPTEARVRVRQRSSLPEGGDLAPRLPHGSCRCCTVMTRTGKRARAVPMPLGMRHARRAGRRRAFVHPSAPRQRQPAAGGCGSTGALLLPGRSRTLSPCLSGRGPGLLSYAALRTDTRLRSPHAAACASEQASWVRDHGTLVLGDDE